MQLWLFCFLFLFQSIVLSERLQEVHMVGIRHSITNQAREGIVLVPSALHWGLECWGQVWVAQSKKDIKLLEGFQRMVKGPEGRLYEEQLRSLVLFSLE